MNLLRIGNKLIEGPDTIFSNYNNQDWLEKDLQIIIYHSGHQLVESYSIWSDSTMNKEGDFLPPLIRILQWQKSIDIQKGHHCTLYFPSIDIQIGLIKDRNFKKLNAEYINLQKSLLANHTYTPMGISTERNMVATTIDFNKEYLDFSVFFRNGLQYLRYSSSENTNNQLVNDITFLIQLLKDSIEPIRKEDWTERYYELNKDYIKGQKFDWNYQQNSFLH